MPKNPAAHPLGTRARILLSSVFGPYAQDDAYGSRKINPMELYHNQVTRLQGGFSLRMFHRSYGLMMIQSNLEAPCTLLDFPSLDRFVEQIERHRYDIVGISSIIPNLAKVKKMCELVRKHLPGATIVVGGHVANVEGLGDIVDADFVVKGDGIRWFRKFLGQNEDEPVRHPMIYSAHGARTMGVRLPREHRNGNTAAMLIPSVGCPVGCNFCSTSSLFGGKGHFIHFYETGDELFSIMCDMEAQLKVSSFFIMDENFLLHRSRALRLLDLMAGNQKGWSLYVFSSARVLRSYTMEQLVGMGISWVWMGLEGKASRYAKLKGVDTHALVKDLQSHGIRVLGSTIIGLESHTPENIEAVIEHAISHGSDFHQFMLYTPIPGTPLFDQHRKEGTLLPESVFHPADAHGQYRFNFRHPHIHRGLEEGFLLNAFKRDFEVNGPSLARLIRTLLTGWQRYRNHQDLRIRARFDREVLPLRSTYAGAVWAMKKHYRKNHRLYGEMSSLLNDIYLEFGLLPRLIAPLAGQFLYVTLKREEKRISRGWTYEPATVVEKNPPEVALEHRVFKHRRAGTVVPSPALACHIDQ